MRTLAQKPEATHQTPSANSTLLGRVNFGRHPGVTSPVHLQRALENSAAQRMSRTNAEEPELESAAGTSPHPAHDFSRIPAYNNAPVNIRAKLQVDSPGDAFEQEADRVAEQVLRMPAAQGVRRKCACGESGTCKECNQETPIVQRKATGHAGGAEAPQIVSEVLRSPGRPLDAATRSFMEPRFGHDFSRVRVHTDARAAQSARAVNALAYTVGQNVVFDQGQYQPGTQDGKRLLAHELTHVAQGSGSALRRKGKTAGDVPRLKVEPALNQPACACVVFVHNEERKARKTARLLHTNCRYNLAMVQDPEGLKSRHVRIPNHGEKDPNSLFPAEVVNACMDDDKSCRDFVANKQGSTKGDESLAFAQRQYFLAIKDCSNNFKLPVVGLHNNALNDTETYRAEMGAKGVADLKLDVDKRDQKNGHSVLDTVLRMVKLLLGIPVEKVQTGADVLDTMRTRIRDKFGAAGEKETLDTKKTTNIFRWCAAADIEQCHAGDPEHPDNVVWVTNLEDYDKLKTQNVNVVFESQKPKPAASESAGDLSTMFVLLGLRLTDQLSKQAAVVEGIAKQEALEAVSDKLRQFLLLAPKPDDPVARAKRNKALLDALAAIGKLGDELKALRFVNIETEGKGWGKESARVANYRTIVTVLTALGIHCCDVAGKGDTAVETGLKGKDD